MTDMREYAAQHGWEVGSHLRYAGDVGPSSVITSIEANEVRISTPGDFPGRLTHSTRLEKWTLDWQSRAEKAEATIQRVRELCECIQTDTYDLRPDSREALRAHERLAVAHMILRALDGGAE